MDQGLINFFAGNSEEAIKNLENYSDIESPNINNIYWLAAMYLQQRHYQNSVHNALYLKKKDNSQNWDSCYRKDSDEIIFDQAMAENYIRCVTKMGEKIKKRNLDDNSFDIFRAVNYSLINDADNAFAILDEFSFLAAIPLRNLIQSTFFDNLKSDPRYGVIIRILKMDNIVWHNGLESDCGKWH